MFNLSLRELGVRERERERESERWKDIQRKGKASQTWSLYFFSVYPPPCGRLRVKKDIIENK